MKVFTDSGGMTFTCQRGGIPDGERETKQEQDRYRVLSGEMEEKLKTGYNLKVGGNLARGPKGKGFGGKKESSGK